jgi:hypothetical protein
MRKRIHVEAKLAMGLATLGNGNSLEMCGEMFMAL